MPYITIFQDDRIADLLFESLAFDNRERFRFDGEVLSLLLVWNIPILMG